MNNQIRFFKTYFIILLIPVTILFILLFAISYHNQLNRFHQNNLFTTIGIGSSLDEAISAVNTENIQLSFSSLIKKVLAGNTKLKPFDLRELFLSMSQVTEQNEIIDSFYVYFNDVKKVMTTNTLYDLDEFYERELIYYIVDNASSAQLFTHRTIASNLYSYVSNTKVLSLTRVLPENKKKTKVLILANINQEKLLNLTRVYEGVTQVSIGSNGQFIASMDATLIGQSVKDRYALGENASTGYIKHQGQWVYYHRSSSSNLLYIHAVDKIAFQKLFQSTRLVMLLMYALAIIMLMIFSYGYLKFSKNRLGYLLEKLSTSTKRVSYKDTFENLEEAINEVVIKNAFIEEKIETYATIVRNMAIFNLITGTNTKDTTTDSLLNLNIEFTMPYFTICLGVTIDSEAMGNQAMNAVNSYQINVFIKDKIEEVLTKEYKVYSALMDEEIIGFIINHESEPSDLVETLPKTIASIYEEINETFNIHMIFSLGNTTKAMEDLSTSYYTAKKNLNYKSLTYSNFILCDYGDDLPSEFPIEIKNKILKGFNEHSEELIVESIDAFFNQYLKSKSYSMESVKNIVIIVFSNTINALWEHDFEISLDDNFEIINSIAQKRSANELNEYLKALFMDIYNRQTIVFDEQSVEGALYITSVVNYMNANYQKDLSISDIAMVVNLNPRYLSSLFKNATGKTMITYLNTLRMKASKILLADPNKSIKSISTEVGYNDNHAFIRHFKKAYGQTPSEYRASLGLL